MLPIEALFGSQEKLGLLLQAIGHQLHDIVKLPLAKLVEVGGRRRMGQQLRGRRPTSLPLFRVEARRGGRRQEAELGPPNEPPAPEFSPRRVLKNYGDMTTSEFQSHLIKLDTTFRGDKALNTGKRPPNTEDEFVHLQSRALMQLRKQGAQQHVRVAALVHCAGDARVVHFVETLHGLVAVVLSALQQVVHGHGAAVVVDVVAALAVGQDLDVQAGLGVGSPGLRR